MAVLRRFNGRLGFGARFRIADWLAFDSFEQLWAGADALGIPTRTRYHTTTALK